MAFAAPGSSARYEYPIDGHVAFANYRNQNGVIAITHTEVPAALRERGIGARMVLKMLDDIRAENLKVRPLCSFARHVVAEHPEYRDLLA